MKIFLAALYLCSPLLLGGCIVEDHDRVVHEHHDHDYDRDHGREHFER